MTLEPLVDLVRGSVESHGGWRLSGVQKTTSYEYGGRWEGDTSRSAYLFFHREDVDGGPSLDVFLDEATGGLTGNLALVLEGRLLGELGDVGAALTRASQVAEDCFPRELRVPLTLRTRLGRAGAAVPRAEVELRVKVLLPTAAIQAGGRAVSAVVRSALVGFARIASHPGMEPLLRRG